jgi:hypothetical protein
MRGGSRTIPVLFPKHLLTLSQLSQREALTLLESFVDSRFAYSAKWPGSALMAKLLAVCLSVTCDPWRQRAARHQLGHLRPTGR